MTITRTVSPVSVSPEAVTPQPEPPPSVPASAGRHRRPGPRRGLGPHRQHLALLPAGRRLGGRGCQPVRAGRKRVRRAGACGRRRTPTRTRWAEVSTTSRSPGRPLRLPTRTQRAEASTTSRCPQPPLRSDARALRGSAGIDLPRSVPALVSDTLFGGGVSERPKEHASKACEGASPPWVQIPPPPPFWSVPAHAPVTP